MSDQADGTTPPSTPPSSGGAPGGGPPGGGPPGGGAPGGGPPGGGAPGGGEPAGGPPIPNWVWIVMAVLVAIVIALLVLLLRGDDDGDDSAATTTSSTSTTSSTTSSTSTSTTELPSTTSTSEQPPDTTTTTTPPVTADPAQCEQAGADPTNPDPAATAVFIAWTRGDVDCADPLMTDDALDELFARDGSGATDIFQGCTEVDEPDTHMDCAFTYTGGSTHYLMNFSATDGWQVYDIEQVAD